MKTLYRRLGFSGTLGLTLAILWVLVSALGPFIAPYGPGDVVDYEVFLPMSAEHPLGTDYLGRSVLSRILDGARFTVGIAFAAALLAASLGTALGLFAAVSGRAVDEIISRFMDTLMSIPNKIFALVMIAAFGSSIPVLLLITGVSYTPGIYRIARALAVNINQMDYIQVARARGEGRVYLALSEVLPNMIHPVLTDFGLRFVYIVLLLSSLSFLGLGVQPPNADLGSLVRENMSGLWEAAPAILAPAAAIASLTIGVNLFIDSLRGQR
jgi:peptide/nickel transport system permease protein